MNMDNTKAEAERLRDEGMNRAAESKPNRVMLGKVDLLDALLRSPDHTGTIDDATDDDAIASAFADGGCWRGTVTRSLARAGYIEKTGRCRPSVRKSAHCRDLPIWRLVDPVVAQRYAGRLRAVLANHKKTGSMAATIEPAIVSFTTPSGATENGQTI